MHGVKYREPSIDDHSPLFCQQRVEINVNFANSIMSAVCVMIQDSVKKNHHLSRQARIAGMRIQEGDIEETVWRT